MKKLTKPLKQIHAEWTREIAKKTTMGAIKRHIIYHAKEVTKDAPLGWAASMRNLVDIYIAMTKVKPGVRHQLDRYVLKWRNYPNIRTKLPKGFDITTWNVFTESAAGAYPLPSKTKKRTRR